jgi:hypothetical protein
MSLRLAHRVAAASVALAATFAATWLAGTPAALAASDNGRMTITGQDGTSSLNGGASASVFSVSLPADAKCPGDTAHKGYLVDSYVVPVGTDLNSLTFVGGYPNVGVDLITTEGVPWVANYTQPFSATMPLPFPAFSWSRYDHETKYLPMGTYNVGIACADEHNRIVSYWNTQVRFTASSTDPGGFTWAVAHGYRAGGGGHPAALIVGLFFLILAVIAGVIWLRSRRPRAAAVAGQRSASSLSR